jgi:hypothetical protein
LSYRRSIHPTGPEWAHRRRANRAKSERRSGPASWHPPMNTVRGSLSILAVALLTGTATVGIAVFYDPGSPALPTGSAGLHLDAATISLSSSQGPDAIHVTVTGSGWAPGTVNITLVTGRMTLFNLTGEPYPYNTPYQVTANASGGFSDNFYIGALNTGSYAVSAWEGSTWAGATYQVTSSNIKFSLSRTTVVAGACFKIKGSGFYPSDVENLYVGYWDNSLGFKILKSFDDRSTGGMDHKVCTKSGGTDWPVNSYTIIVVGDTYGMGVTFVSVTAPSGSPDQ